MRPKTLASITSQSRSQRAPVQASPVLEHQQPTTAHVPESRRPLLREADEFTGFIIIRLSGRLSADGTTSLSEIAEKNQLKSLISILDEFDLSATPLILPSKHEKLIDLERLAAQTNLPPLRSLTNYWRLDARHIDKPVKGLLKRLRATRGVESAYPQTTGGDPVVNAADDDYNGSQGYLDPAPDGIDARWVWTQPNGEGAGIGVIDMEQGWYLTHEDYTDKSPAVLEGDNRDGEGTYKGDHGTAVLGVMIADDNDRGIVGIAPSAGPVNTTSHFILGTGSGNSADAIVAAIGNLTAGDALLIEWHTDPSGGTNWYPGEVLDDVFDAIRLASGLGVIVFEAGGNGNNDLDDYDHPTEGAIFDRSSGDFRESGAIMIGAALSPLPHDRASFSNFGSRIDCYAWGENVTTCGYGFLDPGSGDDSTYSDVFGGTSSATPIVAGAGLLIQGMVEGTTGSRLSPSQMRAILSDPATGTAQGGNVTGNIGVMPDCRAIIENDLGLTPDIYIRDNVGDTGLVPSAGTISASPDIIVRKETVADANVAFGEGSGNENSSVLGSRVEKGQDNFVYVRMKNRGGMNADGVIAKVFWSEVATLVTPDMWNVVGTTHPKNVPMGDTLVVSEPITWFKSDIPDEGHYCFVGILGHEDDLPPVLPSPTDWDGFRQFIRNQNNVTWRNFNVENLDEDLGDPYVAPFIVANLDDKIRVFDFLIDIRFPPGVNVFLEMPMELARQFVGNAQLDLKMDRADGVARIKLPSAPQMFIPKIPLAKGARLKSRFIIEGIEGNARPGNQLCIQQMYEGEPVGGVTWKFDLSKKIHS